MHRNLDIYRNYETMLKLGRLQYPVVKTIKKNVAKQVNLLKIK